MTNRPPRRPAPTSRAQTARSRRPSTGASAAPAGAAAAGSAHDALAAAILTALWRAPNRAVDLGPLAAELGKEPNEVQLEVERLHQRRMLIAPFIEPGPAGGAELTEEGLRWLLARHGGRPPEPPVALQPATGRVRSEDEAARLPRAQVYGPRRP